MQVWYLYHSAFAVETEQHFLIFDYFCDKPAGGGLAEGVISPAEIAAKQKQVVVFVSHGHADHYSPRIFQWRQELPNIRYILSDDINTQEDCQKVGPGEKITLEGIQIETLLSTDLGVAFYIQVEGHAIYHAGDLHWWRWEGEPEDWNNQMERNYKEEIRKLEGHPIDLAFIPLDPRQEQNYALGMSWFMHTLHPGFVLPMHFEKNYKVTQQLQEDPISADYRSKVGSIHHRGECFTLSE